MDAFVTSTPVEMRSIVISMSVCLSVCLHILKTVRQNSTKFYARYPWPWLGPSLMAMRYVMYLWFCG